MENRRRKLIAGAATATIALVAGIVGQSLAAPSEGTKHPPKAETKQFDIVTLASGFVKPTSVDFLPDGTMLVAQKGGRLYEVSTGGRKKFLLDLTDHVANERERGLGTVEVASDSASSRRVYLSYTYRVNPAKPEGPQAMRVSFITLNGDDSLANPASPETIVLGKDATGPCPPVSNKRDCPPSVNTTHQAGNVISDADGTLWVSYGDSNLPSNPGNQDFRTYNPASAAGKVLHVDARGNGLPKHPFCPKDDDLTHTCTKVFARGFRNPFRFSLRGGKVIVSDVGWNTKEEIDVVARGGNYGWPCFEGDVRTPFYRDMARCHRIYARRAAERITPPVLAYKNPTLGAGAAVIIGPQYFGSSYPKSFDGSFFWGDYAQGFIKLLRIGKKGAGVRLLADGVTPVDFTFAPDGNLAFVDYLRGAVRELVYSPANKAPKPQASASPSSGYAPLAVQLSSAGTLDPDGDPMSFDWDFGDGSPHGSGAGPAHTYGSNGTYTVRLTASDGRGGQATTTTTVTVGNKAPTGQILAPTGATLSRNGEAVALQATGSDPEGGPLPASGYDWDVTLVHKDHEHPEGEFFGPSAQFVAVRDHDSDSHYVVTLTLTDGQGLSTTLPPVEVYPETIELTIKSRPKGIRLSYGGRPVKAPVKLDSSIGFFANLSAPEVVTIKGRSYRFAGWSQKGKRVQIFPIPDHPETITAKYVPGAPPPG